MTGKFAACVHKGGLLFFIVLRSSHIALIVFLRFKPSCPFIRIDHVYGHFDCRRIVFVSCIKNYNVGSESGLAVFSVNSYPVLFYILKHY